MSMLNFYINRAGKNLSASRKRTLEKAKDELRGLFRAAINSGARTPNESASLGQHHDFQAHCTITRRRMNRATLRRFPGNFPIDKRKCRHEETNERWQDQTGNPIPEDKAAVNKRNRKNMRRK